MAFLADLSPCDYFGNEYSDKLVSIGWLERGESHSKGDVNSGFVTKIIDLLVNPWQPVVFAGFHACSLCRISISPTPLNVFGKTVEMGVSNLFIPGNGFVYVAPSLIAHYIDAHDYAPPKEFCNAVIKCPSMRSIAYLKAIIQNGPNFNFPKPSDA